MVKHSSDNNRLIKNTMVLYLRTVVTVIISLYSSRVVLEILGVEDYGIYNIVGGFVSLFAVVSQTLVAATQRYLTFELGKRENGHSKEVFSAALTIHIILAILLFVLFESIGLWFMNSKMNIIPERMIAANWVYQFSILSFIFSILRAPYEAAIIAHEKMKAFAYVNIFEATFRLGSLYLILLSDIDRLIQYGFYQLLLTIIIFLTYVIYNKIKHEEIDFTIVKEKHYYLDMISFAGYNFLGSSSSILANQGVNIVLNSFFGVIVNAARGIALQVSSTVSKFVSDFTTALNPQITKSYAQGDVYHTINLVYKGAKFSFFLYLLFALPIFVEAPIILELWLKTVPEYTVTFVRWALVTSLLNTFANPLTTCAFATGQIKDLSIWLGGLRILVLPFVYIAFKLGLAPQTAYVIAFVFDIILLFVRLFIVCKLVHLSRIDFINRVILRSVCILAISSLLVYLISSFLIGTTGFLTLLRIGIYLITTLVCILFLGLDSSERSYVFMVLKQKIVRDESIFKKNV